MDDADGGDVILEPFTPLMAAIMENLPASAVEYAMRYMPDSQEWLNRSDPNMKITPLIGATCRDEDDESVRITQLLLRHGAQVNLRDSGPGTTAVWMAAQNGRPRTLAVLIANGGRIDLVPHRSVTPPVGMAASNGHTECVAVLANASRAESKLELLDVRNQMQGRTPAWCAVARGYCEIVGILAKAGADLRTACPCWYETFIMDGDRTANEDCDRIDSPVQHALNMAVFSHVYSFCVVCRNHGKIFECGRCHLACYCSKECQGKDFKSSHKKVCKRLRKGMGMYGDAEDTAIPPSKPETFGFDEDFAGEDMDIAPTPAPDEYSLDSHPKWEYNDSKPGDPPVWKRYPPTIEQSIERLKEGGSPKYMYRPGHPDCVGISEREISPRPPAGVATRYIWFTDMIERDVYSGAGRAVRRNESCEPQPRPDGGYGI